MPKRLFRYSKPVRAFRRERQKQRSTNSQVQDLRELKHRSSFTSGCLLLCFTASYAVLNARGRTLLERRFVNLRDGRDGCAVLSFRRSLTTELKYICCN